MIVTDVLDLTYPPDGAIVGRHAVWIPGENGWGIKVPFQWGGRVQKYRHPDEGRYGLETLDEERALLAYLHHRGTAPEIGERVYFRDVISEHPGCRWVDPCGAYGYRMRDARRLPPGPVTADVVARLRAERRVVGSDGAWSDLLVPERGNILNGYVIDIRRSGFDMLRLAGDLDPAMILPRYVEPREELVARLHRDGSFPFRARRLPYQEFYLDGAWRRGEREVVQRAEILGFAPRQGESVLDLGCCTGAFLQHAALRGAGPLVGFDEQAEFVDLARALARANGVNACVRRVDLCQRDRGMQHWIREAFPRGVDHLLMLSMGKHLGEPLMWWWVDAIGARRTYLESNACDSDAWPLRDVAERLGGRYVGDTTDRNRRRCYLIERG